MSSENQNEVQQQDAAPTLDVADLVKQLLDEQTRVTPEEAAHALFAQAKRVAELEKLNQILEDGIVDAVQKKHAAEAALADCERERDEAIARLTTSAQRFSEGVIDQINITEAAIARAKKAEAALQPFAEYATKDGFGLNYKGEELPDIGGVGWVYLTNGDFRRARDAISNAPVDFTVDDSVLAGWILSNVGFSTDPSLEPAADSRRSRIANIIVAHRRPPADALDVLPQEVWLLIKDSGTPVGLEINGVFSSKEAALALCDELSGAARLEIGRDYTAEDRFFIATRAHPDGVWADKGPARAAPDRTEDLESLAASDATWKPDPVAGMGLPPSSLGDIADERIRQMEVEGWTPEHDDTHDKGEMALAASAYAYGTQFSDDLRSLCARPDWWPWDAHWWKRTSRRRDLVKAGALIVAEIERLDRAALSNALTEAGESCDD